MITIIVADDEKLIRLGIKKILSDNFGSDLNVLEAKNGLEVLELCKKESPYVVITDIRMPKMDGVELMQEISKFPQKPAIIVLSGFDDFSYAKSAITNGALAYILKPIDTKELLDAVNKALNSVKIQETNQNEQKLKSIISDGIIEGNLKLNQEDFKDGYFCVTLNKKSGSSCSSGEFGNSDVLSNPSENLFEKISPCYVLEEKQNCFTVLLSQNGISEIQKNKNFSSYVVGISEKAKVLSDLRKLIWQSFSAFLQSYFEDSKDLKKGECDFRKNGFYFFTATSYVADFSEIDSRYDKVIASLDLLSLSDIKKNLNVLFDFDDFPKEKRGEVLHYIWEKIVNNLFKRYPKFNNTDSYLYLKSLMIENLEQCERLSEWKQYVLDYLLYLAEVLRQSSGKYPYITKAISYISNHFSEDITMATVANYVSMNYTWFSEKFKEQLGVNFNDYLKKFRMEQAKKLLEKGIYKVYEVASKCGFKDVKHFMKSFREMNGMSAGEWARTHGNSLEDS